MGESLRKVPWGLKEAAILFLVPWVIAPILLVVIISQLAPVFGPFAQFLSALEGGSTTAAFMILVFDGLLSVGLVWLYLRRYDVSWRDVGFRGFNLPMGILAALGGLVVFNLGITGIFELLQNVWPQFNPDQEQVTDFQTTGPLLTVLFSFLALVVITPVIEELVFRGFIFPAIAKRTGIVGGAVLSSALFGLAHMQLNIGIYTGLLGLLLSWLYVRFGSIWPAIILHTVNNYLAYLQIS